VECAAACLLLPAPTSLLGAEAIDFPAIHRIKLISGRPEPDRLRWLGFLARIERRAEKRVLIGADPRRLAELQAGLASLGYAVSGGTDPGTLVQLAGADARPADAVLIDAGWLQNESSTSLVESLFSARNVPCVTMDGEVRRAAQAIDRLLEVVV
jgi:hypothetical protein